MLDRKIKYPRRIQPAVEHREHRATVCKQLERQQRESIELIGREGLQIASASQDERRRKIKDFGGKLGGAYESKERGEKGKVLADGLQQYVKGQRQRNITSGFYQVSGEAPAEQRAKSMDVVAVAVASPDTMSLDGT